jgi:hypothetical protein
MTVSGFVAGTLVHTDKGLVPIEQLKVGDMVLSKHESGEGEQAYKRVVKTFKSETKQPIWRIKCTGGTEQNGDIFYCLFFSTIDNPFYVFRYDEWLWIALIDLDCDKFDTYNNIEIHTFESVEMFAFLDNIHLAWSPNYNSVEQYPEVFVDFKNHHQIYSVESYYDGWCSYDLPYENVIFVKSEKDMLIGDYKATINKMVGDPFYDDVYNIEVEDFHTYYVGKAGILSHDLTSIATYKYMPHQN